MRSILTSFFQIDYSKIAIVLIGLATFFQNLAFGQKLYINSGRVTDSTGPVTFGKTYLYDYDLCDCRISRDSICGVRGQIITTGHGFARTSEMNLGAIRWGDMLLISSLEEFLLLHSDSTNCSIARALSLPFIRGISHSMAMGEDGISYWSGGQNIVFADSMYDPDPWFELDLPFLIESLTYRNDTVFAISGNKVYAIDTSNIAASPVVFELDFQPGEVPRHRFHLESQRTECGGWRTYMLVGNYTDSIGGYAKGIHELNMKTGEARLVCSGAGLERMVLFRAHTFDGVLLPCDLEMDLDRDNSSGRLGIDYSNRGCGGESIGVVDLDVFLSRISKGIQRIEFVLTNEMDGDEWLSVEGCGALVINGDRTKRLTISNPSVLSEADIERCMRRVIYQNNNITCYTPGLREIEVTAYSCGQVSDRAIAYIDVLEGPCAGENNSIEVCEGDVDVELQGLLDSTAQNGGEWIDHASGVVSTFQSGLVRSRYVVSSLECGYDTAVIEIAVNSLPIFDLGRDTLICEGESLILIGPTDVSQYRWNTGVSRSAIEVTMAGEYILEVEDDKGCTYADTIRVDVVSDEVIELDTLLCEGTTLVWRDQSVNSSGTYRDTVIVGNGCMEVTFMELTYAPRPDSTILDTALCAGETYTFDGTGIRRDTSWIQLISVGVCDSVVRRTVHFTEEPEVRIVGERYLCPEQRMVLGVEGQWTSVLWDNGQTTEMREVDKPGTYRIIGCINDCCIEDSIRVEEVYLPQFDLGADITMGQGDRYFGSFSFDTSGLEVLWTLNGQDYSTDPEIEITITEESIITLCVQNQEVNCILCDTIKIEVERELGRVYVPNVFTPNGDNINDRFTIYGENVQVNIMQVFNRWGALIYQEEGLEVNDDSGGWDGTFNGSNVSNGVYVYKVEIEMDGEVQIVAGEVTIFR